MARGGSDVTQVVAPPVDAAGGASSRLTRSLLWPLLASGAFLIGVISLQIAGPSDLFHQTQPRTISYTTDIILNGRWLLPIERGELPATKPPLYNWLAAPSVWLSGFASEFGHKLPSVMALIACWWMTVLVGRRCGGAEHGDAAGTIAGVALLTTYTIYKLGYLARPDMLLTLWLTIGWWSATLAILQFDSPNADGDTNALDDNRQSSTVTRQLRTLRLIFWSAIALAWLTKGPAAVLPLIYALVSAKLLAGSWKSARALGWRWGLPLSLLPFVAWIVAAYDIDPDHLRTTLLWNEFAARIIGQGPETSGDGPISLLTTAWAMPYYFLVRGAPWSALAVAAMVVLWLRRRRDANRSAVEDRLLRAAAVWLLLVLGFFTLSAGKRADYIASAYPAASILAGWLLARYSGSIRRALATGFGLAAASLFFLVLADWREWASPYPPGYGRSSARFVERAREIIGADPRPLAFWRISDSSVQTLLGANQPDSTDELARMFRRYARVWLVAGARDAGDDGRAIDVEREEKLERFRLTLTPMLTSDDVEGGTLWPRTVTLYAVEVARMRRRLQ
jgi:4-amino-4-deoxy-L-arabinose transferase-like glycosyltransferase